LYIICGKNSKAVIVMKRAHREDSIIVQKYSLAFLSHGGIIPTSLTLEMCGY
jgi:hypothetical protein